MMPQAEALYRLQQVDLQIIRLTRRLSEIAIALKNNETIQGAQTQLDAVQERLKPQRKAARDLELEIQTNTQKAKTTEDRLYSGSVKNPKELQEMQQEIESLKRRHAELEDELLEQMMLVEDTEAELAARQQDLNTAQTDWENQHRDLLAEQQQITSEVERLQTQREQALKPVAPESLKLYEGMKGKKANQPVAALQGSSCTVCGIEQTVTIAQEVRRGEKLVPCLNCGRILADVHVNS